MDWSRVNQEESDTPRTHPRDNSSTPADSLFEHSTESPIDQWVSDTDQWRNRRKRARQRVQDVEDDWTNPGAEASEDEPDDELCRPCGGDAPPPKRRADAQLSDDEDLGTLHDDAHDIPSDDEGLAATAAAALDFEQGVRSATARLGVSSHNEAETAGCWGCQYGATMHAKSGDNPKIAEIIRLIRDNHGRMDDGELAKIVARHHKDYIRKPALAAGVPCARWTKSQILRHIRHHTLDPTIVFAENIRTLRNVVRMLKERATSVDVDTGESSVNHRNIDLLIRTIKGMSDLYTKRAHELLFGPSPNNPDYLINPNKL